MNLEDYIISLNLILKSNIIKNTKLFKKNTININTIEKIEKINIK